MKPGLEHPGKQRTRTGTSGGRGPWTGTSGEEAARDWNVRGKEGKEEGKEQMRKDTKNKSREAGREGEEGEAAKHMEPGREQTGTRRTRTGTSGGEAALDWSIRGSVRWKRRRCQETARRA